MTWKTAYRSFYYANAEEPADIRLSPESTALLVIDVQNTYLEPKDTPEETARWQPFYERMRKTVIPNIARLIGECRRRGVEVIFVRIGCHKLNGRDRSLSQKKPGFNYLLIPKDAPEGQVVTELAPQADDITLIKTADSALTGTNLRLILHNMGIKDVIAVGIFTGQCVSSSVRSLADESFGVVVVDDCCGRDHGAAPPRARDHQHDLLPCRAARRGPDLLRLNSFQQRMGRCGRGFVHRPAFSSSAGSSSPRRGTS